MTTILLDYLPHDVVHYHITPFLMPSQEATKAAFNECMDELCCRFMNVEVDDVEDYYYLSNDEDDRDDCPYDWEEGCPQPWFDRN